jgi:DDE family transposase
MILPPPPKAPAAPFAVQAVARLPLAEAFYQIWAYLATDTTLDALFEQHRGHCYQDRLRFADLVHVLTDALTRYHGSARRAIRTSLQQQRLPTQQRAVYGKLARLPLPLAEAFLADLTARLRPLFPAGLYRTTLPKSLADLAVVVLDGKKIKRAAKRLLASRGRPGKLYGGKLLAAYLPAHGLVVALAADPDGEANDIRLLPRALPAARVAVAGLRLWVADRQFCDLDQPRRFTQEGDHFLLRFASKTSFQADPQRPPQTGRDGCGRPVRQEWGWMGAAKDRRRCYVRRITLERPGEEPVVLVTDLLDDSCYAAEDLLAVYLMRWQIENVFQAITEVFALRQLIGCTPQATVFQASLCLVIYNVLQLLRAWAAEVAAEPTPVEALSAEQIFTDLHEELVGLHRLLAVEELLPCLAVAATAEQLRELLRERLGRAWSAMGRKAVNNKRRSHKAKAKQSGAHTSVHKVLQAAKDERLKKQKVSPSSG